MTTTVETAVATGRVARVIGRSSTWSSPVDAMPDIYNALTVEVADPAEDGKLKTLTLEVAQHLGDGVIRAISMQPTDGLVRQAPPVTDTGTGITVPPVGDITKQGVQHPRPDPQQARGRGRGHRALADPPQGAQLRPARVQDRDVRDRRQGHRPPHPPVRQGWKDRSVRWCRCRQDRADPGDDLPRRQQPRRCVGVRGVGERTREGNDLIEEMADSGVIDKTALVFGQMDEPPGTVSASPWPV